MWIAKHKVVLKGFCSMKLISISESKNYDKWLGWGWQEQIVKTPLTPNIKRRSQTRFRRAQIIVFFTRVCARRNLVLEIINDLFDVVKHYTIFLKEICQAIAFLVKNLCCQYFYCMCSLALQNTWIILNQNFLVPVSIKSNSMEFH